MRITKHFSIRDELPFTKDRVRNGDLYAEWLTYKLKGVCDEVGVGRKSGQRYDVRAVYVNNNNDLYLKHNLPPATYLAISPRIDEFLRDSEIAFDMDSILEQGEGGD